MIIDMRVRPPTGSFLKLHIFAEGAEKSVTHAGHPPSRSFVERSMDIFIKELDATNVQGVVMGRQGGTRYGQVPNDEIAALVKKYPNRFIPFAGLKITDRKTMLREVDRAIKELKFVGVNLEPGFDERPRYADDRLLYPVYERCEELGVPVSVSMSVRIGPDISYTHPSAIQRVCNDFPNLPVICSHAAWPYVQEIVGVAWVCTNLYVSPDFYMCVEHMPFAQEFVNAGNMFLEDRLLFGSAYPVRDIAECVQTFNRLPFKSEDVKQKILYRNAAKLFRLPNA